MNLTAGIRQWSVLDIVCVVKMGFQIVGASQKEETSAVITFMLSPPGDAQIIQHLAFRD